ncbi:methyltransferase, FkbM family [Micromonospora halophytica]|uniref:Methyltransferase, FkbM family n=1 Tax=Micromonospora halophytica TaxID=47864 RepID=A0A1C5ILH9_9ACTN|nr:methyltransferase, FkbM family [Micromonospora halophytica]
MVGRRLSALLHRPYSNAYPTTARLRRWRHRNRAKLSRGRTFWGDHLQVRLPDEISIAIRRHGFIEYELSAFFLRHLRTGMTFLDVGAHLGYFTVMAARCVGPSGRVVSFEPTPTTYALLAANTAAFSHVTTVDAAVWSSPGTLRLTDHGVGYSPYNSAFRSRLPEAVRQRVATTVHEVPAVTLDGIVAEQGLTPDVVKVDAESAERDVLEGMRGLLTGARPVVTVEVGDLDVPGAARSTDLVAMLAGYDYRAYELRDGVPHAHRPRASYEYDNLVFVATEKGHLLDV